MVRPYCTARLYGMALYGTHHGVLRPGQRLGVQGEGTRRAAVDVPVHKGILASLNESHAIVGRKLVTRACIWAVGDGACVVAAWNERRQS